MLNTLSMLKSVHLLKHSKWSQIQDLQTYGYTLTLVGLFHVGYIAPLKVVLLQLIKLMVLLLISPMEVVVLKVL